MFPRVSSKRTRSVRAPRSRPTLNFVAQFHGTFLVKKIANGGGRRETRPMRHTPSRRGCRSNARARGIRSGDRNVNATMNPLEFLKLHNHRNFGARDVILNGDYSNASAPRSRSRARESAAPRTSSWYLNTRASAVVDSR